MYQISKDPNIIFRKPDGLIVRLDVDDAARADYLVWIAAGNAALPFVQNQQMIEARVADIARIDRDVDRIYQDAIGNRTTEYVTAEAQAITFKAAGYSGVVPPCVASYAAAAGITATQSCDAILAQAVAWRSAVEILRDKRLKSKVARAADTDGVMAQWDGFVAAMRNQLGLPAL